MCGVCFGGRPVDKGAGKSGYCAGRARGVDTDMLSERFPARSVVLLERTSWHPFPDADNRDAWNKLPASCKREVRDRASAALEVQWPLLPSSLYMEFARDGNRSRFEEPYFGRRTLLTTFLCAECVDDGGGYLERIVEGIWLICEESSWCLPAHISAQRAGPGLPDVEDPYIDLFAAETAAALAWTTYLLGFRLDRVSPLVIRRVRREVSQRIIAPFLSRDDFWWMGLLPGADPPNNWNPWVIANILAAAGLLEEDAERRTAVVVKAMRCLDRFLDHYPRDGGCDEGPGYWSRAGGSVFDCLETLETMSDGRISAWDEPLVREMGKYIARAHVAGDYYVNFADASAIADPPAAVVFGYGVRVDDPVLRGMGAALHAAGGAFRDSSSPERVLKELFLAKHMERTAPEEPLPLDTWLPDVQVMTSRDAAGSARGLFIAAKGGHNAESHNHNDIGSFLVYADGQPLVVDAGVGVYTRATFNHERYGIWTMQSAWHSLLPTIDGTMQAPGRSCAASGVRHEATAAAAVLELDIAGAWPQEAGIVTWMRRIEHRRGAAITIVDDYALSRPARQITMCLLTPCASSVGSGGTVRLEHVPLPDGHRSGAGSLEAARDDAPLNARIETVELTDERLAGVWGAMLHRIVFTLEQPAAAGRLRFVIRASPRA